MKLRCVAVVCVLLAAAGCGQRGPLYLPGDPSEGRVVLPGEELPGGSEEVPAERQDDAPEDTDDPQGPADPEDQNPVDPNPADQDPEGQNPTDDEQ